MVTAESYVPNAPMSIQCFTDMFKSISRKKNSVLPIEKFPFLVLARNTMLQRLIAQFSLCYLSSGRLREVKNKGKFQSGLLELAFKTTGNFSQTSCKRSSKMSSQGRRFREFRP